LRLRVAVLVALVATAVGVGASLASHSSSKVTIEASPRPLAGELPGRAPWPANARDLRARLAALGLPALAREGTALHIHAHLEVFVAGKRVVVPAGIGIDPEGRFISPIHTHDASGVIHVESPTVRAFTLDEFFGVWGVRFGGGCLGGYCTADGRALRVYSDGRPVADPGRLPLAEHEEIVVAFGTSRELPRPVPSRYVFPAGL
jgi:hypothetical protein